MSSLRPVWSNPLLAFGPWVAAAAMVALCLWAGQGRPMHTDEAVNAVILGDMFRGETLRYDAQDRHGPTLLFLASGTVRALGVGSLAGMEAWHVRFVPALCAAALLLVAWGLREPLGAGSIAASFVWLGAGAPFVYFGATFIHEALYVLLTLALVLAGWTCLQRPTRWKAIATGACAGLMLATKEVAPVTLGLIGLAALGSRWTGARRSGPGFTEGGSATGLVGLGLGAMVLIALAFLASFGANPAGPFDLVRGWVRFIGRAAGEGHEKPFFTYAEWLLTPNLRSLPWFGWTLLLCAVSGGRAAFRLRAERPLAWFLVWLSVLTALLYSATPYKTPWVALGVLAPASLIAGLGVSSALSRVKRPARTLCAAIGLAAVLFALGWETRQLCFRFPVDPANPLAYSPTVEDLERLPALLERRLAGRDLAVPPLVQVVGDDYWPLPWYLRRFERVGYWPALPSDGPQGEVVIATGGALETIDTELGADWRGEHVGLRPDVLAIVFTRSRP